MANLMGMHAYFTFKVLLFITVAVNVPEATLPGSVATYVQSTVAATNRCRLAQI